MSIRLILIEEHDVVRQGVRSLLQNDPDIHIVAEASNGVDALEQCAKKEIDLAVIGINMPFMNGVECTRLIKQRFPSIKVLVLSMYKFESYLVDMLQAGADGYILKDNCTQDLVVAIRKIASGGRYFAAEFTLAMLEKHMAGSNRSNYTGPAITDGEMRVLALIGEGLTNTQMANKLFISVRTVESRRKKLLNKTGTNNTATLIKFAIQHGLIK